MKENAPLIIGIDDLTAVFMSSFSQETRLCFCLDLKSGDTPLEQYCDASQVGDTPGDIAGGKRFLRIPPLDDIMKHHVDGQNEMDSLFPAECQQSIAKMRAALRVSLLWLKSLKLERRIEIRDQNGNGGLKGLLYSFNPTAKLWTKHAEVF